MTAKRDDGTFWNGRNHLYFIGGYVCAYICQKSLRHAPKTDLNYMSIKLKECWEDADEKVYSVSMFQTLDFSLKVIRMSHINVINVLGTLIMQQ